MSPAAAWETMLALLIYAGGATAIFALVGVGAAMVWAAFTPSERSAKAGEQTEASKDGEK